MSVAGIPNIANEMSIKGGIGEAGIDFQSTARKPKC